MFSELPKLPQTFYTDILVQSIIALKLNTYLDNFDTVRFGGNGVDRSKEFNGGQSAFFFD